MAEVIVSLPAAVVGYTSASFTTTTRTRAKGAPLNSVAK